MSDTTRRTFLQSAIAGGCGLAAWPAHAATGRVVFGYTPGSPAGKLATLALKEMRGHYEPDLGLDLSYVPGNSGAYALAAVHKADADGSTVLYAPSTVLTLNPQLRVLPGVDVARDFIAVAPLVEFTFAFTVGPGVPIGVRTMKDYVAWVRDNPMQSGYGLPGLGTSPHFAGMALARTNDLPIRPLPYQGATSMWKDLLTGAIPAAFLILGTNPEAELDGRLRPLAITSGNRWPSLPNLPTLRELGMCDIDVRETFGLHLPAATPTPKVEELNAAVRYAMGRPPLMELLRNSLMRTAPTTPQDYADSLAQERAAWAAVVKRERFTIQG